MTRVNAITQVLPATHTTILTLLRKYSPDDTTRTRQYTSDIAYYSIYRPRKDERLSWPSWLTYSGRFTHISGHPSAAGRSWKVHRSKTNVLTTVPRICDSPAHASDVIFRNLSQSRNDENSIHAFRSSLHYSTSFNN